MLKHTDVFDKPCSAGSIKQSSFILNTLGRVYYQCCVKIIFTASGNKADCMRMLLCLLLFGGSVSAQPFYFAGDSAAVSTVDLPGKEPFDTARAYLRAKNPYVYIISDKDLYDYFGHDAAMKFYHFNFADFHILGSWQCRQCALFCNHATGENNCHRNACKRGWVWVKRDNKKAFATIPYYSVSGHERKDLPMYHDTIVTASADTSRWYTTGHGDCFARYQYAIVADKYHPVIILKEWNYWGGCRAGGSKPATIVFKQPEGILYRIKRTILMEKQGH
jgi:hypothetical protein